MFTTMYHIVERMPAISRNLLRELASKWYFLVCMDMFSISCCLGLEIINKSSDKKIDFNMIMVKRRADSGQHWSARMMNDDSQDQAWIMIALTTIRKLVDGK